MYFCNYIGTQLARSSFICSLGNFYSSSLIHHFKFKSIPKIGIQRMFYVFVLKIVFHQIDFSDREVKVSN